MFNRISGSILILLMFPLSLFAGDTASVHNKLEQIGTYLNHQDFIKAQELRKDIIKDVPLEDLAKDLNYYDFIILIQTISWEEKTDDFHTLIRFREIYHPEDTKRASFLTRKNRDLYWKNCISQQDSQLDTIDYAFCVLAGSAYDDVQKKKILGTLIIKQYRKDIKSSDIEGMSDLANLIGYYSNAYPSESKKYRQYIKNLGLKIITMDPHFVNGYFSLIKAANNTKERDMWIGKLKENYIGDADRWKQVIQPYIDSYNN